MVWDSKVNNYVNYKKKQVFSASIPGDELLKREITDLISPENVKKIQEIMIDKKHTYPLSRTLFEEDPDDYGEYTTEDTKDFA